MGKGPKKSQAYFNNSKAAAKKQPQIVNNKVYHGDNIETYNGEQVVKHVVQKRKATRVALRVLGIVFDIAGIAVIWWALGSVSLRMIKFIVGVMLIAYGFYLIRNTFKSTAFDATYLFGKDGMTIMQKKASRFIPYQQLSRVDLVIPDPEIDYHIIHIIHGKKDYVLPFVHTPKKCQAIYEFLDKQVEKNKTEEE